ncbi:MAG: AP2 domain-containing protein [Deltaproteobacteria bacterium]|nr:AP2 domain-containing protein [Deltaproteobacteria bacterium]
MRRISRVKQSWWVRFIEYDPATQHPKIVGQEYFPFEDYIDGEEEALFWAQQWRDFYEKEHPEFSVSKQRWLPGKTPKNDNKSDGPGIHYAENITRRRKKDGSIYKWRSGFWVASWLENNQSKTKSFSVSKFGFEGARREAIEHQSDMAKKK